MLYKGRVRQTVVMKKATEKEDPVEKLKGQFKTAPQTSGTGKRYGRRLVKALQPKPKRGN